MIAGYEATRDGVALLHPPPRTWLRVGGRAPAQMLTGLISGPIPPPLDARGTGLRGGRAPYSVMLTPKGKLVTDLRVSRIENGDQGHLLIELPEAGVAGALTHLRKYLPPRLAQLSDLGAPHSILTLAGPATPELLASRAEVGNELSPSVLMEAVEGDEWIVSGNSELGLRIIRADDVGRLAFDIVGPSADIDSLRKGLLQSGVTDGAPELWEVLRLERGRPRFGAEMDEDTMPAEAEIVDRCVDPTKGCYTGQEVVVRIRDRGHVNRHLRGILLDEQPPPELGTPLFLPGSDSVVGTIRSLVRSPRFDRMIALALVRREIQPPASLGVGSPRGPRGAVRALSDAGWVLVEGDLNLYP